MNKKGHPFLSQKSQEIFEQTYQLLNEEFSEQEKYLFNLVSDDILVDKIASLFNDRIGANYSDSELLSIYKEGQCRFNNFIPPGYKDASKPEPGRYGDLIIWKQLIDKATKDKKSILLISDDEKEDWLLRTSGKTVGPRAELIREFINATDQKFHINSAFKFLQNSYEFRNKIINQPTLDEVKSVSKERRQVNANENIAYQIKCVIRSNSGGISSINTALDILNVQGYSFKSDIIDDASLRIQVNVPYEDLVRRFNNKMQELSKLYGFLVDSFEASVLNNQ